MLYGLVQQWSVLIDKEVAILARLCCSSHLYLIWVGGCRLMLGCL